MSKYYLWTIGEGIGALSSKTLIADRYAISSPLQQIVVDTQPEQIPEMPDEVPSEILPYLKLFPYRVHVPVIYGVIPATKTPQGKVLWLLEQGGVSVQGNLLPQISVIWQDATAMRQLNWLWQMARLWYPLSCERVASSLLNPGLLRTEGSLVRLLELQMDWKPATLAQLGQLWISWVSGADSRIRNFLQQLAQQMIAEELRTADQLVHQLDQALVICGRSFERQVEIATGTDTGPTRAQNEDACYPAEGTVVTLPDHSPGLSIVCDGIGGQEGGEVASQLAIEILREEIAKLPLHPANTDSRSLTPKLKRVVSLANDAICNRNNQENRQGRERMGTTMVMALDQGHEVYITHVGDSRAYWITRTGCYQVTLDDDVASREVRLGYAVYRDALQPRSAGALIQALGITSSANLYPTIQRFPLDEDCIFLLCSDGLSDHEQVEQGWQAEILPALNGETDLATVRDRLIRIANTQNGHDNVTVALLHFHITPKSGPKLLPEISVPLVIPSSSESSEEDTLDPVDTEEIESPTEFIEAPITPQRQLGLLAFGVALLLGLGGLLLYFLLAKQNNDSIQPTTLQPATSTSTEFPVELKTIIQLGETSADPPPIQLLKEFGKPYIKGIVPSGSIFQVLEKQSTPQSGTWLEIKVCAIRTEQPTPATKNSSPEESSASLPLGIASPNPVDPVLSKPAKDQSSTPETAITALQPGDIGWIRGLDILDNLKQNSTVPQDQQGVCNQ
ncbi:MAG: protein phosphatase 2C domain-containing protein [Microcoleaceae cyanobacterium]